MNNKDITGVNNLDVTGQIDVKGNKIIWVGNGAANSDAVNKEQLDEAIIECNIFFIQTNQFTIPTKNWLFLKHLNLTV